jgi:hypothetical protein
MVKRLGELSLNQLALLVGCIFLGIAAAIFAVIIVISSFAAHPLFGFIALLIVIGLPSLLVGIFTQ